MSATDAAIYREKKNHGSGTTALINFKWRNGKYNENS